MAQKIKKGIKLIEEMEGGGPAVLRQHDYLLALRISLNQGDVINHPELCLSYSVDEHLKLHSDGFFEHRTRIDRKHLIPGLFYTLLDMHIGGYRKVKISPHLAYGKEGVSGRIPQNATLLIEVKVIRIIS